jgi:hypothetical protein
MPMIRSLVRLIRRRLYDLKHPHQTAAHETMADRVRALTDNLSERGVRVNAPSRSHR